MPKKQKKPVKKAVPRASSAKGRVSAPAAKAKRGVAKRSVTAPRKSKFKAPARKPKAKAAPPKAKVLKTKAKAPALKTKAKALKTKAKPPALKSRLNAKVAPRLDSPQLKVPARTLILPPKSKRKIGRIAPPPPRTPRAIELDEAALEQSVALRARHAPDGTRAAARRVEPEVIGATAKTVVLSRTEVVASLAEHERAPRPRVSADTWASIEEIATRGGKVGLTAEQRVAIGAALEGRDSLIVIPEDAVAVACYQSCVPLLAQPTVVLSPVLADLQAQSETATEQRKPVVCLLPELTGPERSAALTRIARGGSLLVLLSPEALSAADVQKALAKSKIALFVVEEAHCASDLAHEIRPSYAELGHMLQTLGRPPVMALTRVATSAVLREISERLALTEPTIVQAPAVRSNLRLVTRLAQGDARQAALVRMIERLEPPGLVFCASPHDVDSVYSALRGSRISVHRYHSGMTPGDRATELMNFTLPGERSVMVAVSAFAPGSGLPGLGEPASGAAAGFGRGSGKRDLRFVVHYQSPASIEQYLREIQHAGGDGLPATCVLFHESSHRSLHEVMLAQQRFRATHLAEIGRALEAAALEGRTVTLESLALGTGQSRRTTDRLTALLADAGVVSKAGGWVRVLTPASDLIEACRRLGAQLYALREQDTRRLAAVSTFAESNQCKLGYLNRYLGGVSGVPCGRCSACSSELVATESVPPPVAARRAVVQEFSIRPALVSESGVASASVAHGGTAVAPLTAKLADFGAAMPRGGR